MNRQTFIAKNNEIAQEWLLVDASDAVLGRLSSKLAVILMGKNKPTYTPNHDVGDYIIVTNVEKVRLTGNKPDAKHAKDYSGHTSGLKLRSYRWMLEHRPEELLRRSVRRMLPKNKLASAQLSKLKIYRGGDHPHQAQAPKPLAL